MQPGHLCTLQQCLAYIYSLRRKYDLDLREERELAYRKLQAVCKSGLVSITDFRWACLESLAHAAWQYDRLSIVLQLCSAFLFIVCPEHAAGPWLP